MRACSDRTAELVIFRGGFVADMALVSRLIDIEARGVRFRVEPDGRFRAVPPGKLTPEDVQIILRQRRDEARAIIENAERECEAPQ